MPPADVSNELMVAILRDIQASQAEDRATLARLEATVARYTRRFDEITLRFNALDAKLIDTRMELEDIINAAVGGMQTNFSRRLDRLDEQIAAHQPPDEAG